MPLCLLDHLNYSNTVIVNTYVKIFEWTSAWELPTVPLDLLELFVNHTMELVSLWYRLFSHLPNFSCYSVPHWNISQNCKSVQCQIQCKTIRISEDEKKTSDTITASAKYMDQDRFVQKEMDSLMMLTRKKLCFKEGNSLSAKLTYQ